MEKNSFTKMDYLEAQEAFSLWKAAENAELDEYVLRARKRELQLLLRKVIKNELSQKDRQLVLLHWYEGKSKQEIAELTGLDRSTVFRRFDKINNIIYEKLKYAIEYRYGDSFSSSALLLIKRDVSAVCGLKSLESIGERLARLREEQYLSKEDVCNYTGISPSRLSAIEKTGKEMTMAELKKLSAFFRVSSDYIVFGHNRILRDEKTGRPAPSFS